MQRPEEHITEEESRKEFAMLIPNGWVTNDFIKDYGKDIHLEIFKNYHSSGYTFVCQLKGTGKKIENNTVSIQIATDTLKYFGTLSYPVLLVFYSTQSKQFWACWATSLLENYQLKDKQKMVTVTMTAEQRIKKDFFTNLENTFTPNIANKFNLTFTGNSKYLSLYKTKMLQWVHQYFPACFKLDNPILSRKVTITIDDKGISNKISITRSLLKYELTPVEEATNLPELYKPILNEAFVSIFEAEFLYLFCSIFSPLDLKQSLLVLSFVLPRYTGPYKNAEALIAIGQAAIRQHLLADYERLIQVMIDHGDIQDFKALNLSLFVQDHPKTMILMYRNNLISAIAHYPEDIHKADLYYNLANYYRYSEELHLSSANYHRARKLNPDYLNRFYWWHEYAGILYLSGHFKLAAAFYERSIQMDKESVSLPLTYALKADCLFKICAFSEADAYLEKYLTAVAAMDKMPSFYFALLQVLSKNMVAFGFENLPLDWEGSITNGKTGTEQNNRELLEQAVQLHPMNAGAWFNMGILFNKEEKYVEAYNAFLASALIWRTDRPAWINALILQQTKGSAEFSISILAAMVKQFGDGIINDITATIISNPNISATEKQEGVAVYVKLLEVIKTTVFAHEYLPQPDVVRII